MPPKRDDELIGSEGHVLRVLLSRWITMKGGRERPTSDSLKDTNCENSCFVEGEISLEELRSLFGGRRMARIPVRLLRQHGFWLERRPEEAPEGCTCPNSHVVCGPPTPPPRKDYESMSRQIVTSTDIEII